MCDREQAVVRMPCARSKRGQEQALSIHPPRLTSTDASLTCVPRHPDVNDELAGSAMLSASYIDFVKTWPVLVLLRIVTVRPRVGDEL